ncbi:MAG: palmitoyltransferase [Chaenotheca gracillima]|nr:MAG: palmitoyltransferase [Chaenotheca gracillima]
MGSLEAKIVVLGAQGVGKTSLVQRYVKNSFAPGAHASTVGASFLTKRVLDDDTDSTVRLQIWDTAGQERFRSISKLYYRGTQAALLCYDITDEHSFEEMGRWLVELRANLGEDVILHVVGTKSDLVQEDPSLRRVPFEKCIAYVAEQLYPSSASPPSQHPPQGAQSTTSKRSSGFWGQDIGWDTCHEISAKDGEGVEEVFRVITRKLVEQRNKKMMEDQGQAGTNAGGRNANGQGGLPSSSSSNRQDRNRGRDGTGSFRVGHGENRRSWLGFPPNSAGADGSGGSGGGSGRGASDDLQNDIEEGIRKRRGGKCC